MFKLRMLLLLGEPKKNGTNVLELSKFQIFVNKRLKERFTAAANHSNWHLPAEAAKNFHMLKV